LELDGSVSGRRREFTCTPFDQVQQIFAQRNGALITDPGAFADWGDTSLSFLFDAGGNRYHQIKVQGEMADSVSDCELRRITIT
jgi:hypothetical protein